MRSLILILAFGLASTSATAQVSDDVLKDTAGRYRLSDGKAACTLTFTTEDSIGGWEAKVPPVCIKAFPELAEGAVWTFDGNGGLVIADAMRHRIAVFPEQEGGPYEARRPNGRTWTLRKLDVPAPLTPARQLAGRWKLIRDLKEVCVFDITSNAAGTAGAVKPRPGCDPVWSGWAKWTLKGERLTLRDKGGVPAISLRRTESITFSGVLYGNVHLDLMKEVP
jgi:hypothetical protein